MCNTVNYELILYLNFLFNHDYKTIKKLIYDSWDNKKGILSGKIPWGIFELFCMLKIFFTEHGIVIDLNKEFEISNHKNFNFLNKNLIEEVKFFQQNLIPYKEELKELKTDHYNKEYLLKHRENKFENLIKNYNLY